MSPAFKANLTFAAAYVALAGKRFQRENGIVEHSVHISTCKDHILLGSDPNGRGHTQIPLEAPPNSKCWVLNNERVTWMADISHATKELQLYPHFSEKSGNNPVQKDGPIQPLPSTFRSH